MKIELYGECEGKNWDGVANHGVAKLIMKQNCIQLWMIQMNWDQKIVKHVNQDRITLTMQTIGVKNEQ